MWCAVRIAACRTDSEKKCAFVYALFAWKLLYRNMSIKIKMALSVFLISMECFIFILIVEQNLG